MAGAAAAEPYAGVHTTAVRSAVFRNPADQVWSAILDPELCDRGTYKASYAGGAPKFQMALLERRGELIGEVLSAPARGPAAIAQARSCAREAGSASATRAQLADGRKGWTTFHTAFNACLGRNRSQQNVGSMTLWLDEHCNW